MKLVPFLTDKGSTFYVNPDKVSSIHNGKGPKQQDGSLIAFAGDADDYLFTPLGIEAVAERLTK